MNILSVMFINTGASCNCFADVCSLVCFFDVHKAMLPEIRSSAEIYGKISSGALKGIPISGVGHDF